MHVYLLIVNVDIHVYNNHTMSDHLGGVMVSVLASSMVDHGLALKKSKCVGLLQYRYHHHVIKN